MNHCTVIHSNGDVEATTSVERGSVSWLGNIRGAAAAGKFLFMPTDDGVAQIRLEKGTIAETERFPDTDPFVDSATKLLIGADCLFAVSAGTITRLVINRKA